MGSSCAFRPSCHAWLLNLARSDSFKRKWSTPCFFWSWVGLDEGLDCTVQNVVGQLGENGRHAFFLQGGITRTTQHENFLLFQRMRCAVVFSCLHVSHPRVSLDQVLRICADGGGTHQPDHHTHAARRGGRVCSRRHGGATHARPRWHRSQHRIHSRPCHAQV